MSTGNNRSPSGLYDLQPATDVDCDAIPKAVELRIFLNNPNLAIRKLGGHAMELVRVGLKEYSKRWTRNKLLQFRLGMPEWEEWSDSCVMLALAAYSDNLDISVVPDLEQGLEFVHKWFRFIEHPKSVESIRKRIPTLRRRIVMFEEFMESPGVSFNPETNRVSVDEEYKTCVSLVGEPDVFKYFRNHGLKEYEAYITVFKDKKAAFLPRERHIEVGSQEGIEFDLDDVFFI